MSSREGWLWRVTLKEDMLRILEGVAEVNGSE